MEAKPSLIYQQISLYKKKTSGSTVSYFSIDILKLLALGGIKSRRMYLVVCMLYMFVLVCRDVFSKVGEDQISLAKSLKFQYKI